MPPKSAQLASVHCSVTPTSCAKLLREIAARMGDAAPLAPIGPEPGFEQQLVRQRRRPRRLLDPLAEAGEIRSDLGRGRRGAWRIRGARCAANDLVRTRLAAPFVGSEIAGPLTGDLLVPEQIQFVSCRRLQGQSQRGVPPAACDDRRPRRVLLVGPLRRVAHIRVGEHARHRAMAALVTELEEEPDAVLLDRAADAGGCTCSQLSALSFQLSTAGRPIG
jgi:hypothetical protein